MTTLAYRDGILAADSQETFDDSGVSLCQKLYYIETGPNKGDWCGICGGSFSSRIWIDWYSNPKKQRRSEPVDFLDEDDKGGFRILIMKPDRSLWMSSASCVLVPKPSTFFAAGHGGAFAIGAMAAGKTAYEAVAIACRHDEATCSPVRFVKAGDPNTYTYKD